LGLEEEKLLVDLPLALNQREGKGGIGKLIRNEENLY
jgi:hypothetical protein